MGINSQYDHNVSEDHFTTIPTSQESNDTPPKRQSFSEKHRFSKDIRERIHGLYNSDNYHGPLQCLEDWSLILLAVALCRCITHTFPMNPLLITISYVLTVVVIGARIRALQMLAHDSTHGVLAADKRLNVILGSVMSGWPCFVSWTGYYKAHVVDHHQSIGNPEKDPDYISAIKTGLYKDDVKCVDIFFYLLSIPSPSNTIASLRHLLTYHVWPKSEKRIETLLRSTYWMFVILFFAHMQLLPDLFFYWLVPYLTTANWIETFLDIVEHYPYMTKRRRVNIYQARNRVLSGVEKFLFGNHSEGYHLVHHLWPRMPAWNGPIAHQIMMEDEEYKKLNDQPSDMRHIMKEIFEYFG